MFIEKRLRKDGKVSYRARVVQHGKLRTKTFANEYKAKIWGQKLEPMLREDPSLLYLETNKLTFGEFIDRYIEKELPKNPKSLEKAKLHLLWWKKHLAKQLLCCVNAPMLAELRDLLMTEMTYRGTLRSSSTTNRYLASLSKAFNIAVKEWNLLKENPFKKITRPKEGKGRDRFLEKEEIQVLLAACKKVNSDHLYAFVLFALSTGARKGEVLNLEWCDIDFQRSIATFRETKNGESRSVSLNPNLVSLLRSERMKRPIFSRFVFPSKDGKRPADIRTAWEAAVKLSGLKDVTIHTLRHTCASHLAMAGVSPLVIKTILGHKTLQMVIRYSHLNTSSTMEALNRMNEDVLVEYLNAS